MNTGMVARSLIALAVEMVALALTIYTIWHTRINPFTEPRAWRTFLSGALSGTLLVCLWLIYESATLFLRAIHAVASTKGSLI